MRCCGHSIDFAARGELQLLPPRCPLRTQIWTLAHRLVSVRLLRFLPGSCDPFAASHPPLIGFPCLFCFLFVDRDCRWDRSALLSSGLLRDRLTTSFIHSILRSAPSARLLVRNDHNSKSKYQHQPICSPGCTRGNRQWAAAVRAGGDEKTTAATPASQLAKPYMYDAVLRQVDEAIRELERLEAVECGGIKNNGRPRPPPKSKAAVPRPCQSASQPPPPPLPPSAPSVPVNGSSGRPAVAAEKGGGGLLLKRSNKVYPLTAAAADTAGSEAGQRSGGRAAAENE